MDWAAAGIVFGIGVAITTIIVICICITESKKQTETAKDKARADAAIRDAQAESDRAHAALEQFEKSGEKDPFKRSEYLIASVDASIRLLNLQHPSLSKPETGVVAPTTLAVATHRAATSTSASNRGSSIKLPNSMAEVHEEVLRNLEMKQDMSDEKHKVPKSNLPVLRRDAVPTPVITTTAVVVQDHSIYELQERYSNRVFTAPLTMIGGGVIAIPGLIFAAVNAASGSIGMYVGLLGLGVGGVALGYGRHCMTTALRWFCPGCGKLHHANMPWRCGYCDFANHQNSLLDRCGASHCRTVPKAMECPHCDMVLYLNRQNDARHPARSVNAPLKPVPRMDEEVRAHRQREIEAREHERNALTLDIELKRLARQLDPPEVKPVDLRKKRAEWFSTQVDLATMECHTLKECARRKSELMAAFKNDDSLSPRERKEIINSVERQFDALRIQIERGDIGI